MLNFIHSLIVYKFNKCIRPDQRGFGGGFCEVVCLHIGNADLLKVQGKDLFIMDNNIPVGLANRIPCARLVVTCLT